MPSLKNSVLSDFIGKNKSNLLGWIEAKLSLSSPTVYNSMDIRFSGYKATTVDTNCFPAGFKNLSKYGTDQAIIQFENFIRTQYLGVKRILILAESHTRNTPYVKGLLEIQKIILSAGFEAQISTLDLGNHSAEIHHFNTPNDHRSGIKDMETVNFSGLIRKENRLVLENGFDPDLIVLNNDLTGSDIAILQNIEQPITPAKEYGWFKRLKTLHFEKYSVVVEAFAKEFNVDPWLFSAQFARCQGVDFKTQSGTECLKHISENILNKTKEKYSEYGVKDRPVIYIKSNQGTYGMGIMSIYEIGELDNLNKNTRKKMSTIKHGVENHDVILQEGVYSIESAHNLPAEAVSYIVNGRMCDVFYRYHNEKDSISNLNSYGAEFSIIESQDFTSDKLILYRLISCLGVLAVNEELKDLI